MTTTAEEVGRLRDAEREAELRYDEAVKVSDPSAARNAAAEWTKAADTLTRFIAKYPHPYRDNPPNWQRTYVSYRFCGHGPLWSAWRACCYLYGKQSGTERRPMLRPH
jgi:hypothetical protein